MRDIAELVEALKRAPVRELQATLVRRVPMVPLIVSAPVNFLFTSGKAYRYNTAGLMCTYFAEDERTAGAEYNRHSGRKRQPYATYFAEVRLRWVIDLCSEETCKALSLGKRELHAPWIGVRTPTATQLLGAAVVKTGKISAIRFPSDAARFEGFSGANLVIFRDCVVRPEFVHILGSTKRSLQRWP